MMLFFLWLVAETLFLGSLEDYRGQLRDLSRFLFFPIFPMFSTLLNMVFPICAFWFYALWAGPRKAAAS
ncbi:hypothetical protein [Thalassovita aquimarina]|uniref:hypothetical protein n=1 Tax=Thalassovita aquimarina TaxID=2785917 RepID=UPI001BB0529A|nr:hypothetical protein [Thalassovita aquimarina]